MKVYVAMHCPMTYESVAGVISLHRSEEGALAAIVKHKAETKAEWEKVYKTASKAEREEFPYDWAKWWGVRIYTLED